MSSSKTLFSLPKTQPTLSSSSKSKTKTHQKIPYHHLNSSPEVSAFIADDKQQIYTHNMKIDYGKLSKPFYDGLRQSIKKQVDLSEDLNLLISTRKFKNLKQYTLNDTTQNNHQKQGIEPPIHALLTQKKAFTTQKLAKPANPQSGNKPAAQKLKKKNRIISVKAYETSENRSFIEMIQDTKVTQSNKKTSNKKQARQKVIEGEYMKTDRSDRKISHSRIIKTFNPTAGIQTKIITYPDLSEMFKLIESRKRNN